MRKHNLDFTAEERAAIEAMTEAEMTEAAKGDPDAREMTAEMLARDVPDSRLAKSRAKREAAARALVEQAQEEAATAREREDIGK